jgi:hypothetical protein
MTNNLWKIIFYSSVVAIVITMIIIVIYILSHPKSTPSPSPSPSPSPPPSPPPFNCYGKYDCKPRVKLDYSTFIENANNYAKHIGDNKDMTQSPTTRYIIVNNNCDDDMIVSDIGYHSMTVATPDTLNMYDDHKVLQGNSSIISAYGGMILPSKNVVQVSTPAPLASGRVWPRTNCQLCNMSKGDQTYYCASPYNIGSPYCSSSNEEITTQYPDQEEINKLYKYNEYGTCDTGNIFNANPIKFINCLTGSVPQQCNSGNDCAFAGDVDSRHHQKNAGFGLGSMGKSGKAPSILAEYTLPDDESNDFYDMSQVDGFSKVPMAIGPIPTRTLCAPQKEINTNFNSRPSACLNHCPSQCPPELQDNRGPKGDEFVGCLSLCQAITDTDHMQRYHQAYKKCINKDEPTILDIMTKQTVYWDPNYDASSERIGDWTGDEKTFKTIGKWRIDTDGKRCGFRDINKWSKSEDINQQYANLKAMGDKNNTECKFLIDLACCSTGEMKDTSNIVCIDPKSDDRDKQVKTNQNQFGCTPYNSLYYSENKDTHPEMLDYYKKTTCWHTDWPELSKKWCQDMNIDPQYCSYGLLFKQGCPDAYSWQFNDENSTFQSKWGDYYIEFCPNTLPDDGKGAPSDLTYCIPPPPPVDYCSKHPGQKCESGDRCCDATTGQLCPNNLHCCPYTKDPKNSKCI